MKCVNLAMSGAVEVEFGRPIICQLPAEQTTQHIVSFMSIGFTYTHTRRRTHARTHTHTHCFSLPAVDKSRPGWLQVILNYTAAACDHVYLVELALRVQLQFHVAQALS